MKRSNAAVSVALALAMFWGLRTGLAAPAPASSPLKSVLTEELTQIEREIAGLMMKRSDQSGDKRLRIDMQIDVRIIRRALTALVADARPETPEQGVVWLRLKQFTAAARGVEEAVADPAWAPSVSQKDALALLRKLSFTVAELKGGKELDDLGRSLAAALVNIANATAVDVKTLPLMRPRPIAGAVVAVDAPTKDRPATIPELVQQIQQLASISVPLRQQLMELATAAEKDGGNLYAMLGQSVNLAKGLQANTAVSAENRAAIETQLAEGLALYSDPRTRDAGKSRIDSLGTYRQVLTRIGKMGLTREQVTQLAQGLAWASAAGDPGLKYLATLEGCMDLSARWDGIKRETSMPALKKPLDDLGMQFAKQRTGFMQAASRSAPSADELATHLDEMRRLFNLASDIAAMGPSVEILNGYRPKPAGALERKIMSSATAAAAPTRTPARNDAEKFLDAVHTLADRAREMGARPLSDVPAAVAQNWAGGKVEAFETRWKNLVAEMVNALVGGSLELDKAKFARLDSATALGDSLRLAAGLEAALPKTPGLARWADWSIEPQLLAALVGSYRDSLSAAFAGYVTDSPDPIDRWNKASGRFVAISTLIVRDSAYAEQCQAMPIGLAGDLARLATRLEGEQFGTERYASFAIGLWSMYDRLGDTDSSDRIAATLAKRLARDLHLQLNLDERPRRGK